LRTIDEVVSSVTGTDDEISRVLGLQAEIGIALLASGTLPEMLRGCAEIIVKQLSAAFARIWTLNAAEDVLELQASAGLYTHLDGAHSKIPVGKYKIGLIAKNREPHLTNNVIGDERLHDQEWAQREGMVAFAGYPLVIEDRLVGVLAMFSRKTLADTTLLALGSVANFIALGIERKRAEETSRASEEFSRRVLESSTDCIKVLDLDFHIRYMSPHGMKAMEVDDLSLCQKADWRTFWKEADRPAVEAAIDKALAGGTGSFHAFCPTMKGTPKWWDVLVSPIKDADGRVLKLLSSSRDVTERKEAEIAVHRSMEKFQKLADSMPQMVWTASADGSVEYYNQQWLDYTGLSLEETKGWGWKQTQHPEDLPGTIERWQKSLSSGEPFEGEMRFRRGRDQAWRWHFTRGVAVRDEQGQIIQWIGTCTDIDDRKAAEEVLRSARTQLETLVAERTSELQAEVAVRRKAEDELRELSARLLTLQDTEQRRIARDLHDSAGQLLTATTMSLAVVAGESARLTPGCAAALSEAEQLLQDTIKEVRVVSHLLHPPLLDETGLRSALRWYLEGFSERGHIKVELEMAEDFGRLPRDLETNLFRVVQECLTNVHRHSGSKTARVEVTRKDHQIRVAVEDKGKGIGERSAHGVGLRGMRERVGQFGGRLEIRSSDAGTTIIARLPLPASEAPQPRAS
jgi:PAS domain S-box-containing protein